MRTATETTTRSSESENQVRWYQVPVIWLGIAITVLFFAGAFHMILVSFGQIQPASGAVEGDSEFRGVPLGTSVREEENDG